MEDREIQIIVIKMILMERIPIQTIMVVGINMVLVAQMKL